MRTPGHFCNCNFRGLDNEAGTGMLIGAFVNDCDLIDGDVRNLFILISQIENPGLNIDNITSKGGVSAARYVDLFTQKLF